ncbi:hypothetical protein [Actinomadura parmotrematis]|uniref:ABC transporter permease n=1 Tax=Actinomadura parmotrematis TaxID=2864039 RepID=A0ABS7G4V0_9ACTN|nr:hypothetical protein [Actinomadura parmotrematis]MBW8487729.1 hypothetical protein [Actinomadura parmotrematis]
MAGDNTNADPADDQGVVSAVHTAAGALDAVQFVLLAVAVLAVTGEYATGTIRATLQWTPARHRVLIAKALVAVAVLAPAGIVLQAGGTAVAAVMLGRWGRLDAGEAVAGALAAGAYLASAGVLMTGVAAVLRSTAATLTSAFVGLAVLPMLLSAGHGPMRRVADALPSTAGRHLMHGDAHPYPPAVALLIVAAWAAAGLAAGITVLHRRDA